MLGQRINELRTLHGWNQVQLAKKLNITKQTISNWENGNILPSIEMLIRLADLFHVSTDYLLNREPLTCLDVSGLSPQVISHLSMLVEDYQQAAKK